MGAWSILTVWALVNRTKIGFLQYRLSRAGSTYGKKAKQATSELPFRQEVTVITTGKDRYERTSPRSCFLTIGISTMSWCVTAGAGDTGRIPLDGQLEKLEKEP